MFVKLAHPLLFLLSLLYRFVVTVRNNAYDSGLLSSFQSRLPVVSVGNVTAGGNGKTPLCIFIVRELKARGFRPCILMRGYGGNANNPRIVEESHRVEEVGDEALMLRKRLGVPVVVCPNRVTGAKLIEKHGLGDMILLDDGFQHRRLKRDLDIISVNVGSEQAISEFSRGDLLPLGRFREDRERALQRAHILVFATRTIGGIESFDPSPLLPYLSKHVTMYVSGLGGAMIRGVAGEEWDKGRSAIAFCAIANPEPFLHSLSNMGIDIVSSHAFSDHYQFSCEELEALRFSNPELPLICTEKDAVKVRELSIENVYFLAVETQLNHKEDFVNQIASALGPQRNPRGSTI